MKLIEPTTNTLTLANLFMSHPSIFKRLLAAFYDSLLILATVFIATALTLPFTKGNVSASNNIYMSVYLLVVIYIFCGWFWTHGGQTLGMRVWKQKLIGLDGHTVNWQQSFIRFITAVPAWFILLVGIILWSKPTIAITLTTIPGWLFTLVGFIWVLLNARNNNWRDKLSRTQVILVDKEK
jgi:uncharacterized RDD family membrane protein YckC